MSKFDDASGDALWIDYWENRAMKFEAENRRLRRAFQGDVGSLADAVAENKRLRQALEVIVNEYYSTGDGFVSLNFIHIDKAKAALAEGESVSVESE